MVVCHMVVCECRSVVSDSFVNPQTIQSMEFSRPESWSGQRFPSPRDLPNPGTEPRSPALQADSLPAEPQGKPKNTGVGSLSLLQGIFPTQESNWGLLHCRWVLYQLSYQGSPCVCVSFYVTAHGIVSILSLFNINVSKGRLCCLWLFSLLHVCALALFPHDRAALALGISRLE